MTDLKDKENDGVPDFCAESCPKATDRSYLQTLHGLSIFNQVVTEDKIKWTISNSFIFKSPDLDGILPVLLQWGLEELLKHLVLCTPLYPEGMERNKSSCLHKAGRMDHTSPKAYRPMSLTLIIKSFLFNILLYFISV